MAENSRISWCTHTFNPWVGCTAVSPACDHCYAEAWAARYGQSDLWQGRRRRTRPENWNKVRKWNAEVAKTGQPMRIFAASLADVFDNQVDPAWRCDLWDLIAETPHLDWLLLTKRPMNIRKMLPRKTDGALRDWGEGGYPHVWLGTTVENQEEADRRIPHLLNVPAARYFLSCEPLLSAVDLARGLHALNWVIVGGESGQEARPMDPAWARSLRDQCRNAGASFFMKQMGGHPNKRGHLDQLPADLRIREIPESTALAAQPEPTAQLELI